MTLEQTPVTALKGVGPSVAARLAALHLHTIQDLLFHLPLRYQDRTRISPIGSSRLGMELQIEGEVVSTELVFGRRRSLLCRLKDHSGMISMRLFHFSAAQKNALQPGARVRCYGEIRLGKTGLEFYHPEYQFIREGDSPVVANHLTPVYPITEGLAQPRLRGLIDQALSMLGDGALSDWLPESMRQRLGFTSLTDAVRFLHHPPGDGASNTLHALLEGTHPTQQRLAFEELLSHRLCLRRLRQQTEQLNAPRLKSHGHLIEALLNDLPFALTAAQQRVHSEIAADLSKGMPMLRLLQGDVGSGKTVVAALAALQAVENDYQAAISL